MRGCRTPVLLYAVFALPRYLLPRRGGCYATASSCTRTGIIGIASSPASAPETLPLIHPLGPKFFSRHQARLGFELASCSHQQALKAFLFWTVGSCLRQIGTVLGDFFKLVLPASFGMES